MFATIIPLTKLPLSKPQAYTYRCAEFRREARVGQAVKIPLYNRSVTGIVASLSETAEPNIVYKSIESVLDPLPLVNERDLALARFVSNYYYAPLGIILKHALPEPRKRAVKKISEALTKMDTSVITGYLTESKSPALTRAPLAVGTPRQLQEHYSAIISNCLKNNRQVLFLVPELALIPQTQRWLTQSFPDREVVMLHGSLSKSEQFINWRKAQTNAAGIFLGTRRAAFASFGNLGGIIVDEEQDLSYKQWEMNPRYDARTVCERKANLYKCSLTMGTAAPSVAAYARLKDKTYKLTALNRGNIAVAATIVDMRRELARGNYAIFSEALIDALTETMSANRQAIIFVTRRGAFCFVMCRDCGHIPRCPNCNVALAEYGTKKLACSHCRFRASSPAVCPACNSVRIKGFGSGVERVQSTLEKIFPDKTVTRIDVGNATTFAAIREKCQNFFDKKTDILVGTGTAVRLTSPALALMGAVNIDATLNFPDWRTDEKSWSLIKQMTVREDVTRCVIQTYNPEHRVLQNKKNFYERELVNRERFGYPPFARLIKLVGKSDDYNFLQAESQRVADSLLKILPPEAIIGPIEPINAKIRNLWQKHIIIKLTKNTKSTIVENILKHLSSNWSIDVDPLT